MQRGDAGPMVIDLRRRLADLGFDAGSPVATFDETMELALRSFQDSRGLEVDGRCGPQTWMALTEASHQLGSRLLCLTRPMLRGEDVADLQLRLGELGFDAGRTDGIFGPLTSDAVAEFQRNVGIVADHVCGPETIAALKRLGSRGSGLSIAGLREREGLRDLPSLDGARVTMCHVGDMDLLSGRVGSAVASAGATVSVIVGDDWSAIAEQVNQLDTTVAIAVDLVDEPCCELAFYQTEGFRSYAGERLALELARQIPQHPNRAPAVVQGRRLAILRETKCPTVRWRLGPNQVVNDTAGALAAAVARALDEWLRSSRHD